MDDFLIQRQHAKEEAKRMNGEERGPRKIEFPVTGNDGGDKLLKGWQQAIRARDWSGDIDSKFLRQIQSKTGFDGSTSTTGAAWQPIDLSTDLIQQVYLNSPMLQAFRTITMPTNPYELPTDQTQWAWTIGAAPQSSGSITNATTQKAVLTAEKIAGHTLLASEFQEDVENLNWVRESAVQSMTYAVNTSFLVDDASSGIFGKAVDVTGATPWNLAVDLASTTLDNDLLKAEATMLNLRNQLESKFVMPNQLVWVWHAKLMSIASLFPSFRSLDKFGPGATNTTGVVGSFYGSPVILTDGVTMADTPNQDFWGICAYQPAFLIGQRRSISVKVFPVAGDQEQMEITSRFATTAPYVGQSAIVKAKFTLN